MLNDDTLYRILVVAHIAAVVVGIGGVTLNGVYGVWSKNHPGTLGYGSALANYHVSHHWAEKFIYAIPIFGIVLVLYDDGGADFDQTWIWLSLLLYAIGLGISHGVLFPNARKMIGLMEELEAMGPPPGASPGPGAAPAGPPPQVAELGRLGQQQGMASTVLHVISIALISLMVWKPGL